MKRGRQGTEHNPFPKRFYGNALKSHTASPSQCHYQCLHQPTHLEEDIQTERKLGYNPTLQCLQVFNKARGQLESKQGKEAQKLDHKNNHRQIKIGRRHEQEWTRMTQEGDYTFQEVFLMTSSAESVMLLLWCIFTNIPFAIWMTCWLLLSNRAKLP